ncbi:MAG: hypothetical protein V2A76_13410 [Planctomycetota bacterium]
MSAQISGSGSVVQFSFTGIGLLLAACWTLSPRGLRLAVQCRAVFCSAVIGWLLIVFGGGSGGSLSVPLMVAIMTCASLLMMHLRARVDSLVPRTSTFLDFALWTICSSVICLELMLRLFASVFPLPLLVRADASVTRQLDAYRYSPGTVRWGFPTNERGYYDDPLNGDADPGTITAVAVGDSFVNGAVPHFYNFTTVAERICGNLRIHNIAVNAAGPREYLYLLSTEALPLSPDAVIWCLFLGNDATSAQRGGEKVGWAEEFTSPNRVLLALLWSRWGKIRHGLGETLDKSGKFEGNEIVIRKGAAEYRFTRDQLANTLPVLYPWLVDQGLERASLTPEAFLAIEQERALKICGDESGLEGLIEDTLEAKSRCGSVPLLVVLIPDEFQVDDKLWGLILERNFGASLRRSNAQKVLVETLAEKEIPCLDLLPVLRAAIEDQPDRRLYRLRETHLNVAGNDIAGKALASFLRETLMR